MKIKRIFIALVMVMVVLINISYGVVLNDELIVEDEGKYLYKELRVDIEEQFDNVLLESYTDEINYYEFEEVIIEDIYEKKSIDITTAKEIILNSNSLDIILDKLESSIDYSENEYVGVYELDIDNIQIDAIYNGYKEYIRDEVIIHNDLEKNDLVYIEKEVVINDETYYLINVEWIADSYKEVGENIEGDTYTAICNYSRVERIDNPLTYKITATYNGIASCEELVAYIYEVKFKVIEIENEKKLLPFIIGGSSFFIVILAYIKLSNVKVYDIESEKQRRIASKYMFSDNLNLYLIDKCVNSERYKLVLSNKLAKKLNGKVITIKLKDRQIKRVVMYNGNGNEILI